MGPKKSLSYSGTPMKQLTITESFKNSKLVTCKENQRFGSSMSAGTGDASLGSDKVLKSRATKTSKKGKDQRKAANDLGNMTSSATHKRKISLHYPIGSDSESEQSESRNKPTILMALNKPTPSTPKRQSEPESGTDITPNTNTNRNDSFSSLGSGDSDKTVVYDLNGDESIFSVAKQSKKVRIQNVTIIRPDNMVFSPAVSEEIIVQPDFDIFDAETVLASSPSSNNKALIARKLDFSNLSSKLNNNEEAKKNGDKSTNKETKRIRRKKTKENRMSDNELKKVVTEMLKDNNSNSVTNNEEVAIPNTLEQQTPLVNKNISNEKSPTRSEWKGKKLSEPSMNLSLILEKCKETGDQNKNLTTSERTSINLTQIVKNNPPDKISNDKTQTSDLKPANSNNKVSSNNQQLINVTPKKKNQPSWSKTEDKVCQRDSMSLTKVIKDVAETYDLKAAQLSSSETKDRVSTLIYSPQSKGAQLASPNKQPSQSLQTTPSKATNQNPKVNLSSFFSPVKSAERDNALVKKDQRRTTMIADDQQPSCSNANNKSNVQPSTPPSSPLKRKSAASSSQNKVSSPKKSKQEQSPIKNLKVKTGKQLQKKQMDLFVQLIREVYMNIHLKSLVSPEEDEILRKFVCCEDSQRYIIMKLHLWKQCWYNIFQFSDKAFIDIEELEQKKKIVADFDYLKQQQLVLTDFRTTENMGELLNNLDRVAIKTITKKLTRKEGRNKQENIGILVEYAATQATLSFTKSFKDLVLDEISKKMGDSIKIRPEVHNALSNVYLLATLTNEDFENIQDLFNAVINNHVKFPQYMVEPYVIFYSRDKFLKYAEARKSLKDLDYLKSKKNKIGILEVGRHAFAQLEVLEAEVDPSESFREAPHLKRFTASHVYQRVLTICQEDLFTSEPETVKTWLEYLIDKFPTSQRIGKWYHKLISMYMRQLKPVDYEAAAQILIDVLENKRAQLNEIDLLDLGKLGRKIILMKSRKVDQMYHDQLCRLLPKLIDVNVFPEDQFDAEYIETELKGKRNYKVRDADGTVSIQSVEEIALAYYRFDSYPRGSHCEGGLIKALMMLFLWDIIFKPQKHVPGTFLSSMQSAPLDMFTKFFYKNREDLINDRLDCIGSKWSEEQLYRFARDEYNNNSHRKAVFGLVMHSIEHIDQIDELLDVIDRKLLAHIFKRILTNVRVFSSGMPDLLIWNVEQKMCKFVEVKGHGDTLSTKQELWLDFLQQKGADIAVCYVNSKGNKKTKRVHRTISKVKSSCE